MVIDSWCANMFLFHSIIHMYVQCSSCCCCCFFRVLYFQVLGHELKVKWKCMNDRMIESARWKQMKNNKPSTRTNTYNQHSLTHSRRTKKHRADIRTIKPVAPIHDRDETTLWHREKLNAVRLTAATVPQLSNTYINNVQLTMRRERKNSRLPLHCVYVTHNTTIIYVEFT